MVEALDTHMTKDEETEIGRVFALMCDLETAIPSGASEINEDQSNGKASTCLDNLTNEEEEEILLRFAKACAIGKENDVAKIECSMGCQDVAERKLKGVKNLKKEVFFQKLKKKITEWEMG